MPARTTRIERNGILYHLNPTLVRLQGLDSDRVHEIVDAHRQLTAHIDAMDALPSDSPALRDMASAIETMEYELQTLWGFDLTAAFHIHWTRPNACKCDSHLNTEALFGKPVRVVAFECPLHVGTVAEGVQTFVDDGIGWHEQVTTASN